MDLLKFLGIYICLLVSSHAASTKKDEVIHLLRELDHDIQEMERNKDPDDANQRQTRLTNDMMFMLNALGNADSTLNGREVSDPKQRELKERMTSDMALMLNALGGANQALNGREVSDPKQRELKERMTSDMAFMLSALGGANQALNGREVSDPKQRELKERMTSDMALMLSALGGADQALNGRGVADEKQAGPEKKVSSDMAYMLDALGGANTALNGRDTSEKKKLTREDRLTQDMSFMMDALTNAQHALNGRGHTGQLNAVSATRDSSGVDTKDHPVQKATEEDMNFMARVLHRAMEDLNGRDVSATNVHDTKDAKAMTADMAFMSDALSNANGALNGQRAADMKTTGTKEGKAAPDALSDKFYDKMVADLEATKQRNADDAKAAAASGNADDTPANSGAARSDAASSDAASQIARVAAKEKQVKQDMRILMSEFADLFKCAKKDEVCGILKGKQCCKGFFCKPKGKGRCVENCVNIGGDCTLNENCCAGTCTKQAELLYKCI